MKETWKEICDYNGAYLISSLGKVKSFKGKKERILKYNCNYHGYRQVVLSINNIRRTCTVHQLVAEFFLNHKSTKGLQVDHIDNNRINNKLSNLQVITCRENASKDRSGSSKYTGVCWCKAENKWKTRILINKTQIHLGMFKSEENASLIYKKALKNIHLFNGSKEEFRKLLNK